MGVSSIRASRIYHCLQAQDAHTHSEEAVYQLLWRMGQSTEAADYRYASISLKHLSEQVRMDYKSTQALLRRLIEKLTIELAGERDNHRQTARIWKVYSCATLLRRRKAAGLEWVVRNKGISFVPAPVEPIGETPTGDSTYWPLPARPVTPVGVMPESVYNAASGILEALRQHATGADYEAVRDLAATCRARVPDATDAEIIHFIHSKAGTPDARKPLGFLLAEVPLCFEGESFRRFRREAQQGGEDRWLRQEQFRREARAVLADPDAAEDERTWARKILGGEAPSP